MIKCTCDNGTVHGATGPDAWVDICDLCDGTGELTLLEWAKLNGWSYDGIECEIPTSNGYYALDENDTIYFIDRDFERFVVLKNATPETITNLLNGDHE
jgi:hypothetical protein